MHLGVANVHECRPQAKQYQYDQGQDNGCQAALLPPWELDQLG
jgi:hypothetical protein